MKKLIIAFAMVLAAGSAFGAQGFCGDPHVRGGFGPFDYRQRASLPSELEIVERVHFTPEVEGGVKGATGSIGGDLGYTLAHWPNHHRALIALSSYAVRTKSVDVAGMKYPVECWFNRALRYAPDDAAVHAIYANYLNARGKTDAALAEMKEAVALDPDNAVINYNLGLAYFKRKDYDNALTYAQKAYGRDYPLPGLRKKLTEVGRWVEPASTALPAEAPAPAATEATPQPATTDKPAE
jgi:hypothetical protein